MMVIEPEPVIGHRIRARNPVRLRQVPLALPGRFRMEVHLRNPWGGANAEVRLSLRDFQHAFRGMWQAR